MTVLDKSLPDTRVLMVMARKTLYKEVPLHEDYSYAKYDESLRDGWCRLQVEAGMLENMEQAAEFLDSMLKTDEKRFKEDFIFVLNKEGEVVGSAGLWQGCDYGIKRTRLHMVAVREHDQHKKIAQSMISRLVLRYDSIPGKFPLYLVTQPQCYGAIALYSRMGFTPYMGAYDQHTKEQSEKDWETITQILKEKVG